MKYHRTPYAKSKLQEKNQSGRKHTQNILPSNAIGMLTEFEPIVLRKARKCLKGDLAI